MFKPVIVTLLLFYSCACWCDVRFRSEHALVVDEGTGSVLLDKDSDSAAPIASMTKLLTVMVVLDRAQDPDEVIVVGREDIDRRERIRGGIPVGSRLPRHTLVSLALMASDNHAAAAIARSFEGGRPAFDLAMRRKIADLNLTSTTIEEPTGLSPHNASSAQDLVKVLTAAEAYPEITGATSQVTQSVVVNGRARSFHNTNALVGRPGWDILLSKTGTTLAAGRCLAMRLQSAGRTILVVLMGAVGKSSRALDAASVRDWLATDLSPVLQAWQDAPRATGMPQVPGTRWEALARSTVTE